MDEKVIGINDSEFSDSYSYLLGTEVSLNKTSHLNGGFLLISMGISEKGIAEVVGYTQTKSSNKKESYMNFLGNLLDRGVRSPLLWTGPDNCEFTESVLEVYRKADLQHCIRHKIFSSLKSVSMLDQEFFKYGLEQVFKQKDIGSFLRAMNHFRLQWKDRYPDITDSLEENMMFLMTFFKYPTPVHPFIKSSSLLHTLVKQIIEKVNLDPLSIQDIDSWLPFLCQQRNQILINHPLIAFNNINPQSAIICKEKYHTIHA